jgi:ribonuclease HI
MIQSRRSQAQIAQLEIYTDGSCKRLGTNMTFGGWSFIALRGGERIYEVAGCEYGTTNQRMELLAIRNALEFAQKNRHPNENVIIYSDSAYAINCYTQEWYTRWQWNGWTNAKGEDVANQDLWIDIIPYFDNFWYHFSKVKGHDKNYWNNECDRLAQMKAQEMKENFKGEQNG